MISDVLSDAVSAIEDYQRDMPDVYADLAEEIEEVKHAMSALRNYLDRPANKAANKSARRELRLNLGLSL